ncbi:MAG: hypothetical protein DGJ47_000457 [Rickettsiaceae bacterium]
MIKQYIIALILVISSASAEKISVIKHNKYFDQEIIFYDHLNNKKFLEEYEGENILLVFWASWCGTCVDELPKLDNLQKDFRKLPFKIIAISEDYKGVEAISDYYARQEIRYLDIFYDQNNHLLTQMRIAGLPVAYLVNSKGKVKLEFKGRVKWEDNNIRELLLSEMGGDYEIPKNSFKRRKFFENVYDDKIGSSSGVQNENTK